MMCAENLSYSVWAWGGAGCRATDAVHEPWLFPVTRFMFKQVWSVEAFWCVRLFNACSQSTQIVYIRVTNFTYTLYFPFCLARFQSIFKLQQATSNNVAVAYTFDQKIWPIVTRLTYSLYLFSVAMLCRFISIYTLMFLFPHPFGLI